MIVKVDLMLLARIALVFGVFGQIGRTLAVGMIEIPSHSMF